MVWRGSGLSPSGAKFPVSPSSHVGFTSRLLYISTHPSSESFIHLKSRWAQDAWLQWSHKNWHLQLDISRWSISGGQFCYAGFQARRDLVGTVTNCGPQSVQANPISGPDGPFCNFPASKSVNRHFQKSQNTRPRAQNSKNVKAFLQLIMSYIFFLKNIIII